MDSHPLLQASSQDTCAYFQRTSESASAPSSKCPTFPSKRAAHYSRLFRLVNTSFRGVTPLLQTLTRRPLPKRAAYFSRLFVSVNTFLRRLLLQHPSQPPSGEGPCVGEEKYVLLCVVCEGGSMNFFRTRFTGKAR